MKKLFDEICVFGLGFVGLTTALSFTNKKYKVCGIDQDKSLIKSLKNGKIPFNEPYLKNNLKKSLKNNLFTISNEIHFKKNKRYIIFICVGTPVDKKSQYNLKSIFKVVNYIKKNAKGVCYIYLKSTVLPGTARLIKTDKLTSKKIYICSNPEFLREGKSWIDFNQADKIVIGSDDLKLIKISKELYKKFKGEKIFVNTVTAEFIKQLSNAMLSSMISFSNNFALLAEKHKNIDIKKSFNAIQLDKRFFGSPSEISSYIFPGIGFGGYCLPKDIEAISKFAKKYRQHNFFQNIIKINSDIFKMHLQKILNNTKKNQTIFIMGLSFKEKTDDIRHSKTIKLTDELLKRKYNKIVLCDRYAYKKLLAHYKSDKIKVVKKPYFGKDIIYILGHRDKLFINFLKKLPKKQIIDTRYSL